MGEDFEVNLAGNFGNPVLDFINNGAEYTIIELSSFQLDKMKLNTLDYGVLLNIEPDHLDYHGSFDDYFNEMQRNLVMKLIHILSPHGLQEFKEKSLV